MMNHRTEIPPPPKPPTKRSAHPPKSHRRWRYGCGLYALVSLVGMSLMGGGCFSSLRKLNAISGGDTRPNVASVTLDALTFPVQAVVFGPILLGVTIEQHGYQCRREAFSDQCEQAYAVARTNTEILVREGVGMTQFGCKHLKAIADNSIDLDDRALLTVAVDILSQRGETIVSNVFCRKEWRADTLRMVEPWMFMTLDSYHAHSCAPYFLNPALPQDIAESYTNFPHLLREHDHGPYLEYHRQKQRDLFARRKPAPPASSPALRRIDSFVLDLIGSVQSVTNWQRSGSWDSCVCGDPVSNLTFVTEGGVSAKVSKVYARRQGPYPLTWKAGDPLVDPTLQAMILDFSSPEDCVAFIKELVPVCNFVEPRFWTKLFYRPELKTGRVFAVCTERANDGIGKRLFLVNLAAAEGVRFWTPTSFRNKGPWSTCL